MLSDMFTRKFQSITRSTVANIVLLVNAFVWYYFALDFLRNAISIISIDYATTLLIWTLHFGGLIISALVGAFIINRVKDRKSIIVVWMVFGVIASLATIALQTLSVPAVLMLSPLLGVSLGIGMPCCMGYFTENTKTENRGRLGGIILFLSFMGMVALGATSSGDIDVQRLLLLVWRSVGLVLFLFLAPLNKVAQPVKDPLIKGPTYKSMLRQRPFILYLVPWVMFSLITYLTIPIQSTLVGQSTVDSLIILENALIAVFAIMGGFISDKLGRKRVAIIAFAMLGLGYSALGIFPEAVLSWYFYTLVDGIAWGMLYVIFVVTIWGDLSNGSASDKYYALGVLPFFASKFIELVIGNGIANIIPSASIFSFTAFFLFLAVLPLVYAPETLSEKFMKDRELKSYFEKAQKYLEKEDAKTRKNSTKKEKKKPEESIEQEENSKEFDEARKLAEKYY